MPMPGSSPGAAPFADPPSERPDELAALYRFTDRLFRAQSPQDIYDAALSAIADALKCERASILRFDEAGRMRFAAWRGLSDDYRRAVDGHTPWTLGQGDAEPILVSDILDTDEPEPLKQVITAEGVRGLAFIPLSIGGGVIGKFMLYFATPHRFTEHEAELALTIARQLGFSLERLEEAERRRRAQARRDLLLREMDHRIKNLFMLAGSLVGISARGARDPQELARIVRERLTALARAHALTLSSSGGMSATTLHSLIATILAPYDGPPERVSIRGPDVEVRGEAVTALALLLYEFATNSAKYGALSSESGRIDIDGEEADETFTLLWTESGGPPVAAKIIEGFGSRLMNATAADQLSGRISREWRPHGLTIRLTAARKRLNGD